MLVDYPQTLTNADFLGSGKFEFGQGKVREFYFLKVVGKMIFIKERVNNDIHKGKGQLHICLLFSK